MTARSVCKKIDTVNEWWGRVFSWILVILTILSCFEVFTRRILGRPTIWTHEILGYLFCGTVLLIMAYAQLHKAHVNVDLIYNRLTPRGKAWMDLVSTLVFAGTFCAVFLADGISFAATSWAMKERTPTAFNPIVYPAKTILPVGAALLFLQGLADFLKNVVFLVKGERL